MLAAVESVLKGCENMLICWSITGFLNSMLQKIMLLLDSVIYWAVSMAYQLFIKLATLRLFDDSFFSDFANRIYAILGVFMLFYLAYALLNALINPDKLSGDKGVSKIASNLVISLVLLGFIPTIFDYAYRLQNYILSSNLIGAVILNSSVTDPNNSELTVDNQEAMIRFGDSLAFTVMNTFINPDNYNVKLYDNYNWWDYKADVLENSSYTKLPALSDATTSAQRDVTTQEEVEVEYYVGISTIVGVFLLYIIVSFTLDLGVRVVKFAFCQLIAPVPIIMRAMPGKKSAFDKWLKTTLSIYFEVFVRVAIMYMAVYFVRALYLNWDWTRFDGIMGKLALVVVMLGIFAFAKQAPKMLSDILGIESGNLKLGIGEKLKAGGFFAGGALLGAGVTGLVQRGISGIANIGNQWGATHGLLNKGRLIAGGLAGTAGSMIAGSASGMFNAYRNGGKDAKNLGDMRKAASAGSKISLDNKGKREAYKAAHGGTFRGAMAGHARDMAFSAKEWATGQKLGVLTAAEQHRYDVLTDFESRVKAYEGLWKKEKQWIDADAADRYAKAELQAYSNRNAIFTQLNEDVKTLRKNNSNLSMDDAVQQAMASLYNSASVQDQQILNQGISEYIDLARKSDDATNFLKATTSTIQESKKLAMESMQSQIDQFRDAHKDMATEIGTRGQGPSETKSIYQSALNELKDKLAQAEIKKDKK